MTRYYADSGTPPGVFLGAGLSRLGLAPGDTVTEEHLWRMLGVMADPVTGEPVGSIPRVGGKGKAVAGFDLTFSPSKSVSTMWALADPDTREIIYGCHRRAVEYVLSYAEREVFHSRSGRNGIVQDDVEGAVACAFTHWDNRSGDPQLHDHVVVWNRARSLADGQWRTLDSRGLYRSVVALSEMHQGVLSDLLTDALGVGWDARTRRHSDRPRWEITGVPEALLREFSQRNEQVEGAKDALIARFVSAKGRQPTSVEVLEMRRRATVLTRPDKVHRSVAAMSDDWRSRAGVHIGDDPVAWVESLKARNDLPLLHASDLDDAILGDAAAAVTNTVAERRSVYSRANLLAEAHRLIQGVRFAGPDERVAVAGRIADLAVHASLELTAAEIGHIPAVLRRPDGTSRLRPKGHEMFTTLVLMEAEERLLQASRRFCGPSVSIVPAVSGVGSSGWGRCKQLSADQRAAVEEIVTSGRLLDVLVGPAGAGKSTAMAGLLELWEAEHGPGSVVGLAPSAASAEVLSAELGVGTENTAKWLAEHRRIPERLALRSELLGRLSAHPSQYLRAKVAEVDHELDRWRLKPGQLVIVDEATLAGTFTLDQLVSAATDAGAKVLLVGDWAQLSGVEAGGAFSLLAHDRDEFVPQLSSVRRFRASWEAAASVDLRRGHETVIDVYQSHGRVAEGSREEMLEAIHQAWAADVDLGLSSLMVAGDSVTVAELNRMARDRRVAAGQVAPEGMAIADGQRAGVGDLVVTRRNDRHLTTGHGWVKNGDRWIVQSTNDDGSLTVHPLGPGISIVLPVDYVGSHVELAYATTAHRAQGRTLDTSHVVVSPTTTREALYVAATRGRHANHLYVDTEYDPDPATGHAGTRPETVGREVLARVLANEGADVSAHQTLQRTRDAARNLATLHAEYQTISAIAQADRWDDLLARCGLGRIERELVCISPARGALYAALRDAEAAGLNVDNLLLRAVQAGPLAGAEDVAAVLHDRVELRAEGSLGRQPGAPDLIVGLFPRTAGVVDADMARALTEREDAIQRRTAELAYDALRRRCPWTRALGLPPLEQEAHETWMAHVATVAGYRERWSVGDDSRPLGTGEVPPTTEQLRQLQLAQAAVDTALAVARGDRTGQLGATGAAPYLPETIEQRGAEL